MWVNDLMSLMVKYPKSSFPLHNSKLYIILCSMRSILRNHRFRRDARTLEDEEEMWFNTDEDDLEDGEAVVPPSDKMKSEEDLMEPISKFMERKKCTSWKAFFNIHIFWSETG